MKNSLKTSFESDDAEKLDGRKKDQGRRNWGAFALPDYLCQISFTYRGRQNIPITISTLESGIDIGQGINVGPGKLAKKNKRRALNKRRAWQIWKKE